MMQKQKSVVMNVGEFDPRAVQAAAILNSPARIVPPVRATGLLPPKPGEVPTPKLAYLGSLRMERENGNAIGRIAAGVELAIRSVAPGYRDALSDGGLVDQAVILARAGLPERPTVTTEPITFDRDRLPPLEG